MLKVNATAETQALKSDTEMITYNQKHVPRLKASLMKKGINGQEKDHYGLA